MAERVDDPVLEEDLVTDQQVFDQLVGQGFEFSQAILRRQFMTSSM
jgi:hypothetical protein